MQKISKKSAYSRPSTERIKALVVEDDRNFRFLIEETLRTLDLFDVEKKFAADIKTGMEQFQKLLPDIVLLDINLPDGSGLDMIQPMLELHPAAGIVMITGSASQADIDTAKERGAIGYILKPYSRLKIEEAFQAFIQYRSHFFSEQFTGQPAEQSARQARAQVDFFISGEERSRVASSAPPSITPVEKMLSGWNILFVDRYLTNAENAARSLRKICKHFDIATTTVEFEHLVAQTHYQCILIDPVLPDGNGYQLINALKHSEDYPAFYAIALMPNKDEVDKKKWLTAGITNYLIKPCSFKNIEWVLNKVAQMHIEEHGE